MAPPLRAEPLAVSSVNAADAILEDLDLPDEALANLANLTGADEETFREAGGWAARVTLGPDDVLWVAGDALRWSIGASPETDPSDAARSARRLHGLLGEKGEDWDLDR